MSSLLRLRDYQLEAVEAIEESWARGVKRPAVVLPTGAGKTVCFSHLGSRYLERYPDRRVLILAHTDELVNQAAEKFREVAPSMSVGIVKGPVNESARQVVVASVQSLRNERRRMDIRAVGLIIVDECHHASANTYMKVLEHYGTFDPECPAVAVGFTATLMRGDKKSLADVWEEVAYKKDILFMIKRGYLLDVRGKRIEIPDLDLSGVKKSRGDYAEGALGTALLESMAPELIAKAYIEHASDRAGLLFTPTVESAYVMSRQLSDQGIRSDVVHGALSTTDRREVVRRFESGELQVIANCMALTEGFDSPRASCVVIARPTRSAPLYQQMVGRGLRLYPGQTEALVLDVVGASHGNDLRSLIDLTERTVMQKQDSSLLEMEKEQEEFEAYEPEHYRGPIEIKDFDPLIRESQRVWLTTTGGTRFLSVGSDAYVFLNPCAGDCGSDQWDVVWCSKLGSKIHPRPTGGYTDHRGVGLEYAFAWGETVAEEMGGDDLHYLATKKAPWRKKAASEKQLAYAKSLGLEVPEGAKGGDLSDLIDTTLASRRIDAVVNALKAQAS